MKTKGQLYYYRQTTEEEQLRLEFVDTTLEWISSMNLFQSQKAKGKKANVFTMVL